MGGGYNNTASGYAATVAGGQRNQAANTDATVGGGVGNTASGDDATVGGGAGNTASDYDATVGGGYNNTASGQNSTVGGGMGNIANNNSATVGGGYTNTASGAFATVAGGNGNMASRDDATVGGGWINTASGNQATVAGGIGNTASGGGATVGGGYHNQATGGDSSVPGGILNNADGDFSFAAGNRAQALHRGSFVWSDGSATTTSLQDNQFMVRASGGIYMYTSSGETPVTWIQPGGAGWSSMSDRNAKKNFQPVDPVAVLDKLATIPIEQWNYKWEKDTDVPNIGPMAQDFKRAFYPGRDDKGISTLEFDGVELAAIQGLNKKLQEKDAEIQALKGRLDRLERALSTSTGNR